MTSFTIRPASIRDVPLIVDIRLGAVTEEDIFEFGIPGDNSFTSNEKLREIWVIENKLKEGFEVFVAESQYKIIGFIVFTMKGCDNIDNIVIAENEQNKGVGRALVEYVENLARTRGFSMIGTDTTENSEGVPWKAYGFWRKMGYIDRGREFLRNMVSGLSP